jgi:hypothetical protein
MKNRECHFERNKGVEISNIILELRDYGGRRSGIDRRYFSYSDHIPERRMGENRRSQEERRSGSDRRHPEVRIAGIMDEKRENLDRRSAWS